MFYHLEDEKPSSGDGLQWQRPLTSTSWYVPEVINVQGENLVWDWCRPNSKPGTEAKRVQANPGLLKEFMTLRDAKVSKVLQFARDWGLLFLCEHGLPAWHNGEQCLPLGKYIEQVRTRSEPIEAWRNYAHRAFVICDKADSIYRDMDKRVSVKDRYEIWNRQVLLSTEVQRWLDQAGVNVEFFWSQDKVMSILGTPSLFAALSVQLLSTVSKSSLAICCNCGEIYNAPRRPRSDQRNYCDKDECKLARLRDAQRDRRAGRSKKRKVSHERKHKDPR